MAVASCSSQPWRSALPVCSLLDFCSLTSPRGETFFLHPDLVEGEDQSPGSCLLESGGGGRELTFNTYKAQELLCRTFHRILTTSREAGIVILILHESRPEFLPFLLVSANSTHHSLPISLLFSWPCFLHKRQH